MKVSFKTCKVILILIILLVNITTTISEGADEKVKLRDVEVLEFYENRVTNSRSGNSIPQLKCKDANCSFTPQSVHCKNIGWNGTQVQWECSAFLPKGVEIKSKSVNCEGYDYPGDEFVLQGSCGFEYTLENYNVKLNDVKVLEFTNSRSGDSIPQLKCKGGSAGCSFTPQSLLCHLEWKWNGTKFQGECEVKGVELPKGVEFRSFTINCAGYENAGEKFVLPASCGLEFTIEDFNIKTDDYNVYFLAIGTILFFLVVHYITNM